VNFTAVHDDDDAVGNEETFLRLILHFYEV
jgi:hypothetical protein